MLWIHAPTRLSTVFPERASLFSSTCWVDTTSSSDMTLTRRGMCRTRAWLTSSPTHCCTGRTVSDIETLELLKHNVHRRLSVLRHLSVFGPLYGNVWQRDHLFVACVRMSPISTVGSYKAKSSGTFILSVPSESTEERASEMNSAPSHQLQCVGVERRRKAMPQSALGPISIWISPESSQ